MNECICARGKLRLVFGMMQQTEPQTAGRMSARKPISKLSRVRMLVLMT